MQQAASSSSSESLRGVFPLTEAQQGIWFAQRLAPDNPSFNTAHALWIDGELDVAAFTRAANQAAAEADSLALGFDDTADGPRQYLDAARVPELDVVDLSDDDAPRATAAEMMRADRLTPLDPTRERLACQQLLVLGSGDGQTPRYVWYLRVHHLAADGYAMALLGERTAALYTGDDAARPFAPLAPVLEEDAEYQASAKRQRDAARWHDALADTPPPATLGADVAAGAIAASDCHRRIAPLEAALTTRLFALAEALKQPWPDVLTALAAEYCRRHSDGADAVVGVPYMGRLGSKAARVPAMVMNVLPLALRADDTPAAMPVGEFIRTAAKRLMRTRRHGRYRGEQLRRDLRLIGSQRRLHGPLINVQPFYRPLAFAGVEAPIDARLEILGTGPVDDLTFGFRGDAQGRLDLEIEANPTLYTRDDVDDHLARLPAFIDAAIAAWQADDTLAAIPLATPAEARRYLFEVNQTAHPVPGVKGEEATLAALIEAQMAATPDAVALEFGGQALTYAELERRSRALAVALHQRGVDRGSIVAVALPRSLELEIALVAVLRAGAAYLPLDAEQPDARLKRILDSAEPACLLSADVERFARQSVLAPRDWPTDAPGEALADTAPAPDDPAYVIYTSGSTGEPKGVVVEHRAIINRLLWMRDYFAVDESERILQKTPATFDVSVWEFFLPLIAGARLVIAPADAHRDPRAIARLIRERGITTLHFVPSMLGAFLTTPGIAAQRLRRVIVSGEALTPSLRERFHATLDTRLFNLYGPTEAAVDVSVWEATRDDTSNPVPIGFPVWNTRLYVLDAQLRPLPPGVAGDLYLGGVQLARGYLGQPALTAERFIDAPFINDGFLDGERLYKSGDVARFRRDGAVEYLGRSDDQVKLRGLRIELGDIATALADAPGVAAAEVLLRELGSGEPRLVGYVQLDADSAAPGLASDSAALRARVTPHLARQLPDYMLPAAYVAVDEWPLTANGKLNRRALPLPEMADDAGGGELATDTQRTLAALFARELKLENHRPLGPDADFFRLGGDSLSAVHLLLAIEKHFLRDPGFGTLFAAPTIAALAAQLDAPDKAADDGLGPSVVLAQGEQRLPPLFAVHPAGGIAWNYRSLARSLAQTLAPARTVYGLQSPALRPDKPLPASIEALADDYVATVQALHPAGPVHLAGWSVGGIIAHAMAVRLREAGREVGVVALLDAYPAECWRAEPEPDPDPVAALRALLAIAGYDPEQHLALDTREKVVAFLRRGESTLGNLPEAALDGVVRAVTGTNRLVRGHHHGYLDAALVHLRAGRDHVSRPHLKAALWQAHAAEVEALETPYYHAEMTGADAAQHLAPLLGRRMAEREAVLDHSLNEEAYYAAERI
ncbi:amino acid adenylation domain-containing protein [Halomonas garicola]|uniref:amino acid adenylation domain-containing protein n=1 Tax=Halomonas garicola TaxID=1690008 RepID=UPI002898D52B|nr:amino acid adenylation domain-containing protein [Halomonas garicola]